VFGKLKQLPNISYLNFSNADYSKMVRRVTWSKAHIWYRGKRKRKKDSTPSTSCGLRSPFFSMVSHYVAMYGIPSNLVGEENR